MILELVATCLLSAGVVYSAPHGWTIERVALAGIDTTYAYNSVAAYREASIAESTVTLRKQVRLGETVEPPVGCKLTATSKE